MQNFRDLRVWQKAHQLTLAVYRQTANFPLRLEKYGLTSQMRRGAASVASNIAEGCGRGSDADFGRFLQMAMGSASELEYQLLLSHDLGFIDDDAYAALGSETARVRRMLNRLLKRLNASSQ